MDHFRKPVPGFASAPVLVLMITIILAGCGGGESTAVTMSQPQGGEGMAGIIDIGGSTSVQPLAEKLASSFKEIYPKVKINISGGGSTAGIRAATAGTVDLGTASRDIHITEPDLITYPIARDAVVIVVHPSNPVSALTLEEVRDIYEGTITNWKQVGGNDGRITVVAREPGSGTRDCFETTITRNIRMDALFYDSNGAVKSKVSSDQRAIGFVSLGYSEGLKALNLNGVEPTLENCSTGVYPVLRRLYFVSKEEVDDRTAAFINFCRSSLGQTIIANEKDYPPLRGILMDYPTLDPNTGTINLVCMNDSPEIYDLAQRLVQAFGQGHSGITINWVHSEEGRQLNVRDANTLYWGATPEDIEINDDDFVAHPLFREAIAFVVHADTPVSGLKLEQIRNIFDGTISDWKHLGGKDAPIVVLALNEESEAGNHFRSRVTATITPAAMSFDSCEALLQKLTTEPGTIGFVSTSCLGESKIIPVNGIAPTLNTCQNGKYPLVRRIYALTLQAPTGPIKEFLDFCRSKEGQMIASDQGFVPLNK